MALTVAILVKLAENLLRQALAKLNTPLIEAVDVPDCALSEGQVLVVDDESTQLTWADGATDQDRSRRTVSEEALVGNKLVGSTLGLDLLVSLANHESFGLREVVGGQHLLVKVVRDGVVRLSSKDEIGRNQLGALVHKLEERVLRIGARLAEKNGACSLVSN